ncbi:Vacuolar protein sorting-associated protein ist1 [Coemansia spiralis]|uniref:Vacuolar protein sorting-associated protein ist1 n=2 Tax=Coemansia TaxID=4863 RepID=A0A9W8GEQ9_9FUNG|nr:regulator of Vps4 activity in the MVB pathway-domain-containing protein [Coemansia spiralis]KAJ1996281.1 Vacuolar protein sorting-associated protein ist1 [Coemansia umbellata]KAJ2625962.1 Vacuolar protein sorting-associated protein ist1 [Coemansia sp. RSA 1358]KAJ2680708.1 Vacuolar protein sorting-associated protein ist1 [Coemansia spiralis]
MQFPTQKFKVQLRLAIKRLRLYQAKQGSLNSKSRREIASLLEIGKVASATIRVENIIREDFNIEALEIVELFCELLTARIGLIDQSRTVDPGISDAVSSIIYASTRLDVKELAVLRDMLTAKYGKEIVMSAMDNDDNSVSPKLVQKLSVQAPPAELIKMYLKEIANAYHVNWRPEGEEDSDKSSSGSPGGGTKELSSPTKASAPVLVLKEEALTTDETKAADSKMEEEVNNNYSEPTPKHTQGPKSASGSTEQLPSVPQEEAENTADTTSNDKPDTETRKPMAVTDDLAPPSQQSNAKRPIVVVHAKTKAKQPDDGLPSLEDLQRRFEALKRP